MKRIQKADRHAGMSAATGGNVDEQQVIREIDASWKFVDRDLESRITARFFEKVAAAEPAQTLAQIETVTTVGDLVRANHEVVTANLPDAAAQMLAADQTPMQELLVSSEQRNTSLGAVLERAGVPTVAKGQVFRRLLESLAFVVPSPSAGGMVFARRQRAGRRSTKL